MEELQMNLEKLKEFFDAMEDGKLTFQQFTDACRDGGLKLVDLSEGGYVSRQKYEDEIAAKTKEVETLNETLSTRDTDLADLQGKLEAAGTNADELAKVSGEFNSLKTKYDNEVKSYKDQLKHQAYEFAVKEYANGKQFSSKAAKRDFINAMLAKDLKVEDGKIIGADDFTAIYTSNNEDAFITEVNENEFNEPEPEPEKPQFLSSTPGSDDVTPDPTGGFMSAFHFTPIHPMPTNN